jgi:hypothetical protein
MATTAIVTVENGCIVSAPTNYQGHTFCPATNVCTATNKRTVRKWATLERVFPALVRGRTFMDLGANFCFFCFKALQHGATRAIGIEAHEPYHAALAAVLEQAPVPGLEWVHARWPSKHRADVVMALSLVHHLAVKTPLAQILDDLQAGTGHCAIVEWVDPEDKQATRKGLHEREGYNHTHFLRLVRARFPGVELVGHGHHQTRWIYLLRQ